MAAVVMNFAAAACFAESPDLAAALADRAKYPASDREYLAYVTLRPHVGDEAKQLEQALKLTVASTSTQPILQRCVPQSIGGGVFRLDLRDLRWRGDDWYRVSYDRNPYAAESTLVVRADWLVQEISDQQESDSYLRLLFGGDRIPKTIDDVRRFFQINDDPALRFGAIIGQSGVNKQGIRWMESRPAARGYYWETFDALQLDQQRDPLEHIDGSFKFDGSETIVGMPKLWLGDKDHEGKWGTLQAYFLSNAKNELVARAPVDLVEDSTCFRNYREIRNPGSCIQCHAAGLNIPQVNELRRLLQSGVNAYAGKDKQESIEAFHLGGLTDQMTRANDDFQTMVTLAAGDKPTAVVESFKQSMLRYDEPLNLELTATELGIEAKEWAKVIGTTGTLPSRFASLPYGGSIPRAAWEQGFADAWYAVHGGRPLPPQPEQVEKPQAQVQVQQADRVPAKPTTKPQPKPAAKSTPVQRSQPQQFFRRGRR